MNKDSIGNRMKINYEKVNNYRLIRRTPVIIRIDGKSFHSFTKRFERPFDNIFRSLMLTTMDHVASQMQGFKMAYMQSDEISFLITDFDYFETQPWFGYELAKINSVTASMASAIFNNLLVAFPIKYQSRSNPPCFDCRAFNIPREEVPNYFRWRLQDCVRNSIQAVGQANFSHKDLHRKNQQNILNMLKKKNIYWENDIPSHFKYGTMLLKDFFSNYEAMTHISKLEFVKEPTFLKLCEDLMKEKDNK